MRQSEATGTDMEKNSLEAKRSGTYFGRASLTVESACLLPLFFLGMVTLILIMQTYRLQLEENIVLSQKARELGMYANTAAGTDGDAGVQDLYIDLYETKSYHLPVSLIPRAKITYVCRARVRAWTGYWTEDEEEKSEQMVYVTENESVYHTCADCSYLDMTVSRVRPDAVQNLRNDYGSKYHACEKCNKDNTENAWVYYTKKGQKYHASPACSGLKRTVRLVPLSEVSGLRLCSRCAKRQEDTGSE